jgi:hypothetical protein
MWNRPKKISNDKYQKDFGIKPTFKSFSWVENTARREVISLKNALSAPS